MTNFTELEQKVLDFIKQDIEWDSSSWFEYWIVENYSDIPSKELRGIFSSLVQKGILKKMKEDGVTYFSFV